MSDLGKTIRIIRQAKQMSVGDLAQKSGVSVPFVSMVERGDRQPSLAVLRAFANTLDVPSEALVLMAFGKEADLRSSDATASQLANTVSKLIEMETRLTELLSKEDGIDARNGVDS